MIIVGRGLCGIGVRTVIIIIVEGSVFFRVVCGPWLISVEVVGVAMKMIMTGMAIKVILIKITMLMMQMIMTVMEIKMMGIKITLLMMQINMIMM